MSIDDEKLPFAVYEYDYQDHSSSLSKQEIVSALNLYGAAGWRAIGVTQIGDIYRVWLLRES